MQAGYADEAEPEIDDTEWYPHGSKTVSNVCKNKNHMLDIYIVSAQMFMLDLLDSLPRLRVSDDQMKAILWVMKESGAPHVPTFGALRRKQKQLASDVKIMPTHHASPLGNHFYMNHPAMLLALVSIIMDAFRKFLTAFKGLGQSRSAQPHSCLSRDNFCYLRIMASRKVG